MKTRLVFKVNIARKLVRMGYRIVDLKPAKTKDGKTDFNKSIYVFADENNIAEEIEKLTTMNVQKIDIIAKGIKMPEKNKEEE